LKNDEAYDLDARPVHTVTVRGFFMSKYQVTQAQYQAVTGQTPSRVSSGGWAFNYPVETVSWYDAVEFCNKLSELEGFTPAYTISGRIPAEGHPIAGADVVCDWSASGYRLPTEAEWEYAAKGGSGMGPYLIYSGSNIGVEVAWYNVNQMTVLSTHPVGTKAPNALGIYDLSGNVWEWCWDWFGEYTDEPETDPKGPASGPGRVKRGGCWSLSTDVIRSAYRNYYGPSMWYALTGIRLVRLP
jgi:formylglycine-generating enzyme required for sulfatase activity